MDSCVVRVWSYKKLCTQVYNCRNISYTNSGVFRLQLLRVCTCFRNGKTAGATDAGDRGSEGCFNKYVSGSLHVVCYVYIGDFMTKFL